MKNIKKYIIGFIVGILSVGTITYAADNGSIGALFEQLGTGDWVLVGGNIKDGSVGKVKLTNVLSGIIDKNTAKTVFSGYYRDLKNKPAILVDTKLTEAEVDNMVNNNGYLTSTLNGTFNVKEICDENGYNCVTVSEGLSSDTYSWYTGSYSTCTAVPYWSNYGTCTVSCGGGIMSRTCITTTGTITRDVVCKKNNITTVSDVFCTDFTKPNNSTTCTSDNLCIGSSISSCNIQSCVPVIGESYGGGKYVGDNIVVQSSDLGTYNWSNAITACSNLVVGGQSDWVLPSKTQLNSLYQQKNTIGGFSNGWYWSSTEGSYGRAQEQGFFDGSQGDLSKSTVISVRCIRTF